MENKLEQMFELQEKFMTRLGISKENITSQYLQKKMQEMMLAIMVECGEVLDEKQGGVQWKPWRQYREITCPLLAAKHREYVKMELIDIFHFLLEAMILWNINPDELFQTYKNKMLVNIKRQEDKY